MKKLLSILLVLTMMLTLAACGEKKEEAPAVKPDRLARIKEAGVLEVATEPYFAPCEFIVPAKDGAESYIAGYDMEIAKYIADAIGVELKIVPLDYSAVLSGVAEGKYDLAISGISYSPEREESMRLSKGYVFDDIGCGIMVREADADKYQTVEDMKDAVIICQSASVQEMILADCLGTNYKELKHAGSMTDCYLAVQEGKADLCPCNAQSAQLYAEANGGLAVPAFRFDADPEYGSARIAACLDDTESLIEVVNQCIDELLASKQIEVWREEAVALAAQLGIE